MGTAAAIWAGWNSIVDMDYDDLELDHLDRIGPTPA